MTIPNVVVYNQSPDSNSGMSESTAEDERRRLLTEYVRNIWDLKKRDAKLTQDGAASAMGMTQGGFWQYLNGRTAVSLSFLRKFLPLLGMSVDDIPPDLLALVVPGGPGETERILRRIRLADVKQNLDNVVKEPLPDTGFTYIQKSSLVAGLGDHRYALDSERVVDTLAFKTRWLEQRGFDPNRLGLISCSGDSMAPTIMDGDLALVDLRPVHNGDGIYAVIINSEIKIKRISTRADGSVIIASDNPAYRDEEYPAEQAQALIHKIGKVVWVGREFS